MLLPTQGLALAMQVLYHLSCSASPFYTGYFGDRVSLYAWASLDLVSPSYTSQVAGMTGTYHSTQPLVEMGSYKLFAGAGLKPQLSRSLLPKELGL
jgi:hypothetical protein